MLHDHESSRDSVTKCVMLLMLKLRRINYVRMLKCRHIKTIPFQIINMVSCVESAPELYYTCKRSETIL